MALKEFSVVSFVLKSGVPKVTPEVSAGLMPSYYIQILCSHAQKLLVASSRNIRRALLLNKTIGLILATGLLGLEQKGPIHSGPRRLKNLAQFLSVGIESE